MQYEEIDRREVNLELMTAAGKALMFSVMDLGIIYPSWGWMSTMRRYTGRVIERDVPVIACALIKEYEIWLNIDEVNEDNIYNVICHEARHLWQWLIKMKQNKYYHLHYDLEADARAYAEASVKAMTIFPNDFVQAQHLTIKNFYPSSIL